MNSAAGVGEELGSVIVGVIVSAGVGWDVELASGVEDACGIEGLGLGDTGTSTGDEDAVGDPASAGEAEPAGEADSAGAPGIGWA